MNRRNFLKSSAAGLALTAAPAIHARQAGKKYSLALIGSGWWGTNILREALASGACSLVALCDCDQRQLAKAGQEAGRLTSDTPKHYGDFRELLHQEKPEIVINATPDHWHALITIEAVKSGAHVYVEKPICHTVREGRAMVQAARAADRVVQVGTHRRVSPHNISGRDFIRSGKAGKVGAVRAFVHYGGGPGKPVPDEDPPAGLDWDLYCGPAPLRPYNPSIHPRGFRSFLDFANGQLGDWGIHWMDQILWCMEEKYPRRVSTVGGRFIRQDNTTAPDTQVTVFEFESFTATWEHRLYAANHAEKHNIGAYFYGTSGTFHMGWLDGWNFYPADGAKPVHQDPKLNEPDQQNIKELWADFLGAIQGRKRPVCDIEIGHRSTAMALLGMLSLKLGRSVQWDGEKEEILGDAEANQLLARPYRAPWTYPL